MGNKMVQISGRNSTNIQVAGNLTIGVSFEDAKQIALSIFKDNFLELSEKAANTALTRTEELVNEFILTLYNENQNVIDKLKEPAIQYSLFNVQREYAKTGDIGLKEQELTLLIERISSEERSLKQIVLDEAIETLPKLSQEQLNFICYVFVVDNLTIKLLQKESDGGEKIDTNDFLNKLGKFSDFSSKNLRQHMIGHLQYLGCIREFVDSGKYFDSPINTVKNLIEKHCGYEVTDENIVSVLKSINTNLAKYYRIWNMRRERTIKLTTVGLVIAITHYNRQTDSNIKIDDFI
jgi:hypothetical protein